MGSGGVESSGGLGGPWGAGGGAPRRPGPRARMRISAPAMPHNARPRCCDLLCAAVCCSCWLAAAYFLLACCCFLRLAAYCVLLAASSCCLLLLSPLLAAALSCACCSLLRAVGCLVPCAALRGCVAGTGAYRRGEPRGADGRGSESTGAVLAMQRRASAPPAPAPVSHGRAPAGSLARGVLLGCAPRDTNRREEGMGWGRERAA